MKSIMLTLGVMVCMATTAWAGDAEFYCSDHFGRKVAWSENKNQDQMALAGYKANGMPIITTNSEAAGNTGLGEDAQKFLRYHECGRLVLGHELRPGAKRADQDEQVDQADCWAANRFYYAGEEEKLAAIQEEINGLELEAWNNIAGPARKLDLESICRFKKPVWPN